MQFNFNFEAFEKSGKDKAEAINYLKNLNSSIDFDKLESEAKGDNELIYNALKIGNFSFSKPSVEEQRQKFLKNKENEALKAEFHASTSWLDENQKENYNFYDFKKAKEFANSKAGKIEADLKASEKELKRKKALYKKQYENAGLLDLVGDSILQDTGLNYALDVGNQLFKGSALENKDYISSTERANIEKSFLQSARQKVENGAKFEDLEALEKRALSFNNNEADREKAFLKEKEKQRLIQKGSGYSKAEIEFMEEDLGFFHTLFNDDKETKAEFKDKYFSEGVIKSEVQRAVNTLKQFDESELLKNIFADKKESEQLKQKYLSEAYKIAELSGFDDVGLSKENELYFIKKDEQGNEQKYKVNTGFLDNFTDTLFNAKFEIAAGITGALAGAKKGKTPMAKVLNSIAGGAVGSFGGALTDAKLADMALNRESDFKRNLDYAIQAGVLSVAGDGVMLAAPTLYKNGVKPLAKGAKNFLENKSVLGFTKSIPTQNISAAENIINEVFTPEMKAQLKEAREKFGGGVKGEDLANPIFSKLEKEFGKKYGKDDEKTQKIAKLAEIFNANSLKTRQQEMLDLIRSDKDGSTLAYLLEVAKDDVKIQQNLKNMLNIASFNMEKNLKNLNIKESDIKSIMDEFESGNKAAFKEVESQISKLYDDNFKVVLDKGAYESVKEEFLKNGVNLDEATPFLKDIENNVFSKEGVTFTQLNNFRKNLNYYIFNKDKSPNFINSVKKVSENILKSEIDKGIDNIFNEIPSAYESIKELYSTSLKDYAAMKELNESVKKLGLQDKEKTTDEVVKNLIKFAKGQGEADIGNLDRLKNYLGEENNAFLEMQILNRLFKESIVENERAKVRVIDSEGFLNRVKELVGEREVYAKNEVLKDFGENFAGYKGKEAINKLLEEKRGQVSGAFYKEGLGDIDLVWGDKNYGLEHILERRKEDFIKQGLDENEALNKALEFVKKIPQIIEQGKVKIGKNRAFIDTKENRALIALDYKGKDRKWVITAYKMDDPSQADTHLTRLNTSTSSVSRANVANESIAQPFFKSKEAREFLELIEGFHTLYKNDASIAKAFTQGTASHLSTSIATTAEGAIKQKVVKGGFDPIFRLLPEGILFGLFSKQIQGGALRYHLKKALSRSLNYDDFKIKLEKQLSKSKFNNATLRLIDSFMQNLEDFNKAKEAKLAQKEAKRKAELEAQEAEAKRIKAEQNAIYETQAQQNLKDILESDEPLKDFGTNYAEFYRDGKGAVLKLLKEQSGQVQGAFHRKELGDIDLVWGDESFGLKHIIDKHGGEFENLAKELSEAVENGKIVKDDKGRLRLEYENKIVGIKDNWKGEKTAHWVVTAYVKKEKEASLYTSASFTKGETLPLNSSQILNAKPLNLTENIYLKDNDTPLKVEYAVVKKEDLKPTFTLSKTQFRSEKQEALIKNIVENFNADLIVNKRGDLKNGNPIVTQKGEVLSGNHRVAALKELEGENLSKYQNAVKKAFNVDLNDDEILVRLVDKDISEADIKRFAAASNEGLENNLGEQGVSLFAKYKDKITALKEQKEPFIAEDVYNLKELVNRALGEKSFTKQEDTNKALFASLAKGRNNTILKALNELEKENLEQVSKVANMFFDNAGAFYNLTHDLDLPKMQNLQNYFSDVLVSAAKADYTRAVDFTKLNEDIRAFLDSADKEAMLKLSPNLVSDLLTKAMGAGFARFARLENPSASLFDFLKGLKEELIEKGVPDLFSGGKGIKLNERDEFDFAKELILKGQDSNEKFKLYGNLEELKAWSEASKKRSVKDERTQLKEAKGSESKTKLDKARVNLSKIDEGGLSEEQKELLRLFKGEIKSVKIQVKDLKDIYTLKQGSRKEGAKKILIKHYGEEKTGGLSDEELLNLKEVIKKGEINLNSLEIKGDILRYGYDYEKDGVKLRVVVDDYKDGKKIFDYYSDRNFNHYEQGGYKPDLPTPNEIIPQIKQKKETLKGFINELEAQKANSNFKKREKVLNKVLNLSENEDKIIKEGFVGAYGEKLLRQGIEENELYVKKLLTQLKELESIDKQSEQYALKLKELDRNIEDYWDNFVGKKLLYSFRETQDYTNDEKIIKLRKWGREKFESLQNAFREQIRDKFEVLKRENANLSKNVESENEALSKAQKAWLEAFGLKSIEEAYTPKFSKEVDEALERVLNGEQIKLTKGSYEKLLKRDREEFLPFIKETLENADAVLKDKENALIFVKDIGKKSYFTSVAKNANNEWVISTNSLKTLNTLKNRLDDNGELLYLSKEASNILAEAFTKRAFSNELANESIAQKPQEIIKQAKE